MSKIEIGRYSELLRRMLGMKGTTEVAGELSPEISPIFVIEDPGAEWDFLKSVRGGRLAEIQVGVAGFGSVVRLRNPVGSGVIAVVDLISITPEGATNVGVTRGTETTELFSLGVSVVPDLRWESEASIATTLRVSRASDVAGPVGDVLARTRPLAGSEFVYSLPIVMIPGTSVDWGVGFGSTNETIHTFAGWRERQLPALEE